MNGLRALLISGSGPGHSLRLDRFAAPALVTAALFFCTVMGSYLASGPSWLNPALPEIGPVQVIGALAGIAGLALAYRRPDVGVIIVVALLYSNASEVAVRFHGFPSPLLIAVAAILAGAATRRSVQRSDSRRLVLDPVLVPLALYALVIFASSLGADRPAATDDKLVDYAKGLIVFVLMTNLITAPSQLRRIGWVLVLSGAFLGTISVYQFLTHSYDNELGGFGRIKLAQIVGETREPRIAGSLSDPNFYAQILVMVLPIALYRLWEETELRLKALAGYAVAVIALAAVFTYSRGGAMAMGLVLLLALFHKRVSPRYLLLGLAVLAPLYLLVPDTFGGRLTTLTQFTDNPQASGIAHEDSSFRQRRLLMTVAWEEFLDHPLIGVGAGNYTDHFDDYADKVGSTQRSFDKIDMQHFPHSLPLEILAETGLAGMTVFLVIIGMTLTAARSAYRSFRQAGDGHTANLVVSVVLAIVAFLTTSVFLHGAYIQYLWLVVAIAATARQIGLRQPQPAATLSSDWIWQIFGERQRPVEARIEEPPPRVPQPRRPEVAYVMSRFPLLTETFILREMLELERQGVSLMVFPLLRAKAKVRHAELDQLQARVWYTPFLSWPILRANLHFLTRHPRRYLGVLWTVLRGNWGSTNLFFGALGIFPKSVYFARLVETQGIRHIHAHYATHPALAALIAAELAGVSFSFTAHAHDIFLHHQMLGEKARRAQFVAAISQFNKDYILERAPGLSPDRIKVVHCGIEPAIYGELAVQRTNRPARHDGILTAVCVASLQPYKGIRHLIRAAARIRNEVPGFRCLVAGEGAERAELEALIIELGLAGSFELPGGLPQDKIAALLAEADLFVLPSVIAPSGQMEGIPVALMEAMASGLAVVATRISGIPELVEHGRNGLLVEPEDEHALAAALLTLCSDPVLRERLGSEAQRKVAAEFELHGNTMHLHRLFASSLSGHGGLDDAAFPWLEEQTVLHAGPASHPAVRRAGGGRDSEVYEVSATGSDGLPRAMILKLHRPHWARNSDMIKHGEIHARREYDALVPLAAIFAEEGPALSVPRPLGFSPDHAAVLMDMVPGDKLTQAMRWAVVRPQARAALHEWFADCGEWLATWHAASARTDDCAAVIDRAKREFEDDLKLCWQRGFRNPAARRTYYRFLAGVNEVLVGQSTLVDAHCDFAPYNVLVAPGKTTVIDFEGVRPGFAYEDLAYFLGMLEATPPYHLSKGMIASLRGSFLDGYRRRAAIDNEALEFFMLLATVKIMGRSPVLQAGGSLRDQIKRWQRLRFYRRILAERLA